MASSLIGIFLVLHGLVHLWYSVLAERLVAFEAGMGWSGRSWAFSALLGDSATRSLASVLYLLAALAFIVGGAGFLVKAEWWRTATVGAAILSSLTILLLWDGSAELLMEKGAVGLLISLAVIAWLLLLRHTSAAT